MLLTSIFGSSTPVDRATVNGLIVSTVLTTDLGYETAIIDRHGAHPVERYPDKEAAQKGHNTWCLDALTVTQIRVLGCSDLDIDEEIIELYRYSAQDLITQ